MNSEFFAALDLLEATKGIPKEYMIEKVEAALISAFKKEYGTGNVRVVIDPEKKDVKVFECKDIVETVEDPATQISLDEAKAISRRNVLGGVVEKEVKTKGFGRLSAQTAKQVIIQGIREAERSSMLKEYEKKREEVITAIVTKAADTSGDQLSAGARHWLAVRSDRGPFCRSGDRSCGSLSAWKRHHPRGPRRTHTLWPAEPHGL